MIFKRAISMDAQMQIICHFTAWFHDSKCSESRVLWPAEWKREGVSGIWLEVTKGTLKGQKKKIYQKKCFELNRRNPLAYGSRCKIINLGGQMCCHWLSLQSFGGCCVTVAEGRWSAFYRLSAAGLIMRVLMQTEAMWTLFISLALTKSLLVSPLLILPPALPPPLPSVHLLPPFLLQRMRGIRSILSLSLHPLPVVFLPPPNARRFPTSFVLLDSFSLSAYSTQSKWSHSRSCISVRPVSPCVCSEC